MASTDKILELLQRGEDRGSTSNARAMTHDERCQFDHRLVVTIGGRGESADR